MEGTGRIFIEIQTKFSMVKVISIVTLFLK